MIFDDIFYPGNPERRNQVYLLRSEIITAFSQYQTAWNTNTDLLNGIFAKQAPPYNIVLKNLKYNIKTDTVDSCIGEINDVIADTKKSLNKLVDDIGLNKDLPKGWDEKGIRYDPLDKGTALNIGRDISAALSTTISGFVTFYVYSGIRTLMLLLSYGGAMISNLGSIVGGALGGIVCGAVSFVITDMISSAITGAIQRKELEDAISALTELKNAVGDKLNAATVAIGSITQSIKDGLYKLDATHILLKQGDGSYTIITIPSGANKNIIELESIKNRNGLLIIPAS